MTDFAYVAADADGRILYHARMPYAMFPFQSPPPGGRFVVGFGSAETHYVKGDEVLERPASTAVLDGMTLKSLPVPCTITLEGVEHDCTDDTCELSFSHPGTYTVTVSAWPMFDAIFEVTQA
jgi:hypothetical protein